jgi:ABC-type transport system involved in multi-copper enzyme maturation permease subunit
MANLGHAGTGATDDVVRDWMTMYLFAALFGALLVGREYASGTIVRSTLLAVRRSRLLAAKVIVGAAMGVLYGLLTVGAAVAAAFAVAASRHESPIWTDETGAILAGLVAVSILAAVWGVLLGWLLRRPLPAIAVLVVTAMGVEPALARLVPALAQFLPTVVLGAIYHDARPDLLPVPLAVLVFAGWLAVAGFAAHFLLRSRDI